MELYCTAGRGTEVFVRRELADIFKQHLRKVNVTDGKVFFTVDELCPDVGRRVHKLSTVERMFVHVLTRNKSQIKGKREVLTFLHTELNQRVMWENAAKIFDEVKISNANSAQGYDPVLIDPCVEPVVNKRAKFDEDHFTDEKFSHGGCTKFDLGMPSSEDNISEIDQDITLRQDNKSLKRTLETSVHTDNKSQQIATANSTENAEHNSDQITEPSSDDDNISPQKILKVGQIEQKCPEVTFRVSCKFAGSVRHRLNAQRSVKQMGMLICKLTGWKIDLKHPKMEISIHMNDEKMVVGIPISREPLSKRSYIKHHGLRSTVCRIMADLAQIQPCDVVLDPMCGKATILLEAANLCQTAVYLGMDINEGQIKIATENVEYGSLHGTIQIFQGNTLNIPLPDMCVDKIVTDAPFGQNHAVETDLYHFYFNMLMEASRVLKSNGIMVLLTSTEVKNFLIHLAIDENISNIDCLERQERGENGAKNIHYPKAVLKDHEHAKVTVAGLPPELCGEGSERSEFIHSTGNLKDSQIERISGNTQKHCEKNSVTSTEREDNVTQGSKSSCGNSDIKVHNVGEHNHKGTEDLNSPSVSISESSCTKYVSNEMLKGIDELEEKKTDMNLSDNTNLHAGSKVYDSFKSEIEQLKSVFVVKQCHYMKLGVTDGYICVLQNIRKI